MLTTRGPGQHSLTCEGQASTGAASPGWRGPLWPSRSWPRRHSGMLTVVIRLSLTLIHVFYPSSLILGRPPHPMFSICHSVGTQPRPLGCPGPTQQPTPSQLLSQAGGPGAGDLTGPQGWAPAPLHSPTHTHAVSSILLKCPPPLQNQDPSLDLLPPPNLRPPIASPSSSHSLSTRLSS